MSDHLSIALSAAVPLHIAELKAKGGPNDEDLKKAVAMSAVLGERADVLMFGAGKKGKKGEVADMFNGTARAIAVLSFMPGGISLFGGHWEAKNILASSGNPPA